MRKGKHNEVFLRLDRCQLIFKSYKNGMYVPKVKFCVVIKLLLQASWTVYISVLFEREIIHS